jgi:hypothetical protein
MPRHQLPVGGAGFTSTGVGDGEAFRLNNVGKRNLNLWGVAVGIGVGVGVGDALAIVLLRMRFGLGELLDDSAAEDDGLVVSAGEVASVVFGARCFGGEADSTGVPVSSCDSTRATQTIRTTAKANGSTLPAIQRAYVRHRIVINRFR